MINFRSQFHCNPSSKGALCRKVKERNKNCYDLIENNVHPHRPWEMCFFLKDPVLDPLVRRQQSHLFTHTPSNLGRILWTKNSVSSLFAGNFYIYQSGEASSNFGAQLFRRSQLPKPFITEVKMVGVFIALSIGSCGTDVPRSIFQLNLFQSVSCKFVQVYLFMFLPIFIGCSNQLVPGRS